LSARAATLVVDARPHRTRRRPTIDAGGTKRALCFDIDGTLNEVSLFARAGNQIDHDPEPSPQTNSGLDGNPARYDALGRLFRAGARGRF
jgi:hypothetical protein